MRALKDASLVVWEDDRVALYVPMGQMSIHELQIMVKRPGIAHYLDLNDDEVGSFSKAEFYAIQLYKELGILSFNGTMLSLPLSVSEPSGFRLIFAFVTREVDIAVSELNQLYVVDKHPQETLAATAKVRAAAHGARGLD